ncbi:MAG: methionine--tRNA ligase [Vulcanimicrobiaceae bacterium]
MTDSKAHPPFYVTTPIYYISGNPHIGHAYTEVAADVLARTARTCRQTFFLTGTDEHGGKVANAAAQAGLSPQAWTDQLIERWKGLAATYEISFDDFIRTTEPRHISACIKVFEKLKDSGDVYLGTYEGWYCTNDETFWLESELIEGRCPNPECRREVQWVAEENWFFRLSKYRDRLLEHFRANPSWVRPQRVYNEMVSLLEEGLHDLSISRANLAWGIPLPSGGVMYVWFDALLNYITALDWEHDGARFKTFWPANVQLIGREIARFHTIIWPATLWALGLQEPRLVYAHGWITVEGEKMSKSKGNVSDPFEAAAELGADSIRYFLMREAPFGNDFSISREKFRKRHNGDLGNDLGNLLRRSLAMLARYRESIVPAAVASPLGERFASLGDDVQRRIFELDFRGALDRIWELVTELNRAIDERKPWVLFKEGRNAELDALLYELCEGLRWLAVLLHPYIPEKAEVIWTQLGLDGKAEGAWRDELTWGRLAGGTVTHPGEALFPRIEAPVEAGV